MDFVAIDFETANEDYASICQIGIVRFRDGEIVDTYSTLIDPEDDFSGMNIAIHGITEEDVDGAPTFPEVYEKIVNFLDGEIVVSHTHFDRSAWRKVLGRYSMQDVNIRWLDSARVVRRAWQEHAKSGWGLKNITKILGIEFQHHDALEDARAAGLVMLAACKESSMSIEDWIDRVELPIDLSKDYKQKTEKREANPDGPLYGEVLVFTGTLSIKRNEAADLAAKAGCEVGTDITKKTTLLVLGDQDTNKLKEGEKLSSKQRKAKKLIEQGQEIRTLYESDFFSAIKPT